MIFHLVLLPKEKMVKLKIHKVLKKIVNLIVLIVYKNNIYLKDKLYN